tara:strand:+ start:59 stop:346 length:288 start_codon:yes stop_codon:yes gene_type:complete
MLRPHQNARQLTPLPESGEYLDIAKLKSLSIGVNLSEPQTIHVDRSLSSTEIAAQAEFLGDFWVPEQKPEEDEAMARLFSRPLPKQRRVLVFSRL